MFAGCHIRRCHRGPALLWAAMVSDSVWPEAMNQRRRFERRQEGNEERQRRGGEGRRLARNRWAEKRSTARAAERGAKRRQVVVGRVRLRGKGPPPRLGPINRRVREEAGGERLACKLEPGEDTNLGIVNAPPSSPEFGRQGDKRDDDVSEDEGPLEAGGETAPQSAASLVEARVFGGASGRRLRVRYRIVPDID